VSIENSEMSQVAGWEGQPGSEGVSRQLSSVVQSTRVGGVTFFKNTTVQETNLQADPAKTTENTDLNIKAQ